MIFGEAEPYEPVDVLITVMTYPLPSQKYQEIICTAGVTREGKWVRLYPVDYRYRPGAQRYQKYQWINIGLGTHSADNDPRPESRRPDVSTIKPLGPRIGTENGWAERRSNVDKLPHHTVRQLRQLYLENRTSLGIVRPSRVLDIEIERVDPQWKPSWRALFEQARMFGPQQLPLRKLPFTFRYVFECEDSGKPHKVMITDWELGALFLRQAEELGSDDDAAESVREKFLGELCHEDKDTRFFMGTIVGKNTWLVLGVFWPPKIQQPDVNQLQLLESPADFEWQ